MEMRGIGAGIEERRSELGFEEDLKFSAWTLHFKGVFSFECTTCNEPNLPNCAPQGRMTVIF